MEKKISQGQKEKFNSLVREQFWDLFNYAKLDVDDTTKSLLLPQSVLGRAIEGHGIFNGRKYPEATMESIVSAIWKNPSFVRHQRQLMVNDFLDCVDRLLERKTKYLTNRRGAPIYGSNFNKDFKLDLDKETFKGVVIAGRMDSIEWRIKTNNHYNRQTLNKQNLEIGGGKEFPINIWKLKEMKMSLESLAKESHSEEVIQLYKNIHVITDEIKQGGVESTYIRYEKGLGTCDDAALIRIGLNHGISAMVLGFCVDATDTYGKFIEDAREGGMDEYIGEHIAKRWKEKYNEELVTPEECMDVIYFAAKNNFPKIPISSSHRRFVQYEKGSSFPTFVNHVRFIEGKNIEPFKIGFDGMRSGNFYSKINKRLELMNKR